MTIGPHLLGGRHVEHDPASRAYGVSRRILARRNIVHNVGPHLNQADLGSCEGNTGVEWFNWTKAVGNRKAYWGAAGVGSQLRKLGEDQAIELYSAATRLDNKEIPGTYPPEDVGTTALGVAKAMVNAGGIVVYNWTFDFESFLAQLQRTPIMLGTNWYKGMFEVDKNGYAAPGPNDQDPDGGHAFLAHAVDFRNERVGCTNHWINDDGTPWGIRIGDHPGSFWARFPVVERLLAEQGDSLVPALL